MSETEIEQKINFFNVDFNDDGDLTRVAAANVLDFVTILAAENFILKTKNERLISLCERFSNGDDWRWKSDGTAISMLNELQELKK